MKDNKKSNIFSIIIIIASLSFVVGAVGINNTLNQSSNLTPDFTITSLNETVPVNVSALKSNKTVLAKVFNEDNLDFDTESKARYLEIRKNFSDSKFTNITSNIDYNLKVGAKIDTLRAISINNNNYVIDLIKCKLQGRYCTFRINGVPAVRLHSFEEYGNSNINSFDIDGSYILKVNSIKFNHCEGTGFCHFGYQSYDVVDVMIERKK